MLHVCRVRTGNEEDPRRIQAAAVGSPEALDRRGGWEGGG
jgi:hypothetical protein